MLRPITFFVLATATFAGEKLDLLVNAAPNFSATRRQQLKILQSGPSPGALPESARSSKTQYAKNVEVRGLSPPCAPAKKGDTFLNFGGE
jgi:hypothetical protein